MIKIINDNSDNDNDNNYNYFINDKNHSVIIIKL